MTGTHWKAEKREYRINWNKGFLVKCISVIIAVYESILPTYLCNDRNDMGEIRSEFH